MSVRNKALGLMCGIMVLVVGTGAALAADNKDAKPVTLAAGEAGQGSIMVETGEDGVTRYSTDGGETWTESLPEGMEFELNEDGSRVGHSFIFGDGEIPEGAGLMVQKDEEGNTRYSTDGGETWTEGLPEGEGFELNEDGTIDGSFALPGIPSDAEMSTMMIKMDEEGNASYSTDGGETWTEGLPEGAEFEFNEDGGSMVKQSMGPTAI